MNKGRKRLCLSSHGVQGQGCHLSSVSFLPCSSYPQCTLYLSVGQMNPLLLACRVPLGACKLSRLCLCFLCRFEYMVQSGHCAACPFAAGSPLCGRDASGWWELQGLLFDTLKFICFLLPLLASSGLLWQALPKRPTASPCTHCYSIEPLSIAQQPLWSSLQQKSNLKKNLM